MPHLEFQTYAGQLFWLAVCFVLLYAILWRVVLPRISGVIDSRGKMISDDLQSAEFLKNEAGNIDGKYEKLLAETGEKARKMIDESALKAKTIIDKKRAELSAKLDEKMAKAEKEIARIEKQSIAAVDKMTGELSSLIVSKFKAA